MAKLRKISIALDPSVVDDLDYLSARLGVSRSALIGQFLSESSADVRRLIESIPLSPEPVDLVRFRGDSVRLVEERVSQVRGMVNDLFAE